MGFTFKGKHSQRDMGVLTKIASLPIAPEAKTDYNENIPYMDGSVDFSESGGRVFFKDKILEVDFTLINQNISARNQTIERFAAWLNSGKGELILDDMPLVKWIARAVVVDDMAMSLKRAGKTTVEFRCEPFNSTVFDTDGIYLDADIPIDSDISIGWGDDFEKALRSGTNTFTITNDGTAYIRPVIRFSGSFSSISISVGDTELSFNGEASDFAIDCEKFACFNGSEDVTGITEGEFPELAPGDNTVTVNCTGSGSVVFEFSPKFYYDALPM